MPKESIMMNAFARTLLVAGALLAAGCASRLTPAPVTNEVTGRGEGAMVVSKGVHVTARAQAWQGTPQALHEQVTPMLVTISNQSGVPIRVAYNQFRLVSDSGRRYSAIPPFQIDGQVKTTIGLPHYPAAGFGYAPYLEPYYASVPIYPFEPNIGYWHRYGTIMRTVNLPTEDMLQKALPEGVLQPGGRVRGFLYFEGVGSDVERVQLRADFRNPRTGNNVTRISIPFVVG
jgi:hypothetical protein